MYDKEYYILFEREERTMKTSKKIGALLLVLLMLAGMMTAVSARVYTELYGGLGSLDSKEMYDAFVEKHVPTTLTPSGGTTMGYDETNQALRVTFPAEQTGQGRMHFKFKAEKGTTYAISVKVKANDAATTSVWLYSDELKPRINASGSTATGDWSFHNVPITADSWTTISDTFTYMGETKEEAKFYFVNQSKGYDYLVDDITVVKVADSPIVDKVQEIYNRPFDTKADYEQFMAFEFNSREAAASISYDETEKAMKVEHIAQGQGRVNMKGITHEKGSTYEISYRAKAAVPGGSVKMNYYVNSSHTLYRYQEGKMLHEDLNHSDTLNSNEWKDVTIRYTYLGETKSITSFFYFYNQPDSNVDDYYVKDFKIKRIVPDYPELKASVTKTAYMQNEVIKPSVYGVKDGEETLLTEGVTYKTSDAGVVAVRDGKLVAVSSGTAKITAFYDEVPVEFDVTITVDGKLDLSKTEKTMLTTEAGNNTSQLIVDAVYSASTEALVDKDGNKIKDVTFTSSNNEVATVSETGLVTAKKNGIAVITAEYFGCRQSILFTVGRGIRTINYDSSDSYTSKDETISKLDSKTRTGSGHSLWINAHSGNQAGLNGLFYGNAQDDVTQWWFYDDGEDDNKGFFQLMAGTSQLRLNLWIRPVQNGKFVAADGDSNTQFLEDSGYPITPGRTKGWHQFAVVRIDNRVTCYLDGVSVNQGVVDEGIIGQSVAVHYQRWGTEGADIWVDEISAIDLDVPSHDVTISVGENGTVKYDDTVIESGEMISVEEGGSLTLTVTPNEGYKAKVLVDNQEVVVQDNSVTLENVTSAKTVAVTFEEVVTEPSISGNNADYIMSQDDYEDKNGQKHFAYIAYYKAVLPVSYQVKKLGMTFGDGENSVDLNAEAWTEDFMFGIRVFGDAVQKENNYTFKGFAVVDDGSGNETTIETAQVTK